MEDETHKEFPSIHLLYQPVRQMVYAILFNLHHYMYMASKSKEKGGKYWSSITYRIELFNGIGKDGIVIEEDVWNNFFSIYLPHIWM
jgi:hypothetical protein